MKRWVGARLLWACSTAWMMRARVLCPARVVTRYSSSLCWLMLPANTRSPGCLSTGRLSPVLGDWSDRKSTRLNSSHVRISYAVLCVKKTNRGSEVMLHERVFGSFCADLVCQLAGFLCLSRPGERQRQDKLVIPV